ncbi:probable calcium-binding protein CML41 [Dioscorea cayenensis subsp. rotundata]|uniref:Probable calcium-binding protein CML41 n=1 Tax=Dioscorea cayennensis subsp. rotundata TaxID=55577 RepID=A0AB40CKA0_DIOCR|nr:probable calcium-binding protein CML41 [Dioscorea cayenensis subsp. rotundata]
MLALANIVLMKPSKWLYKKSMKLTRGQACKSIQPNKWKEHKRNKVEQLQQVFQYLDNDKDGKISAEEIQRFFAGVGEEVPVKVAKAAIDGLDSGGDGKLEFEDFVALMEMKRNGSSDGDGDGDDDEVLKMAFEVFEGRGEGIRGRITAEGLQKVLRRVGEEKSLRECKAMITAYDLDGNGEIDFHEFHCMMTLL